MSDFLDRLRRLRRKGSEDEERRAQERSEAARHTREVAERVDSAADEVETHIERCLKEFHSEFVEFRYEAHTREGTNFRVYWDEPLVRPDGSPDKVFHQLSFRVRRYYEYADVEVVAKAIVRNRDRRRCAHEEDVSEGDPKRLLSFVEREILEFTKLYTAPEAE
ncbi:MAG: hypothetical protein O7J95_20260 [Planctomycetota bacterium]|nr:hypothetical protein [Planctomycetota bacterium]